MDRYTALVEQNVLKAARDMERVLDVSLSPIAQDYPFLKNQPSYPLFSKQFFFLHGRDLLGCSAAWFLLDIIFYGSNLYQSHIFQSNRDNSDANGGTTAFRAAYDVAKLQAIVACCSTIPGYFAAVFLIDRVGRVRLQVWGFILVAIIYFSSACVYWKASTGWPFKILFAMSFFFANCGPNTTTFIVPAELFPARFRSTCHGIAGASGKVGAMIGAVGFLMIVQDNSDGEERMKVILIIWGAICLVGMAVTMLFVRETMGTSLEENEQESEDVSVQG